MKKIFLYKNQNFKKLIEGQDILKKKINFFSNWLKFLKKLKKEKKRNKKGTRKAGTTKTRGMTRTHESSGLHTPLLIAKHRVYQSVNPLASNIVCLGNTKLAQKHPKLSCNSRKQSVCTA